MDVQEAIGTRRTYRYLLPYKPVEREKIQKMLEAARIASHWGNVQALKAVVVERATASEEVLESLLTAFPGGFAVVSHDRRFMSAIAREVYMLEAGALRRL
jgi:nitroreductase